MLGVPLLLWGFGCYRPPVDLPIQDPVWEYGIPVSDPTLDAFVAAYPLEIAPHVAPDAPLDAPAMRRLLLERSPPVQMARAALAGALAARTEAGCWPNPEAEARALWNEGDELGIEGGLQFRLPISGRLGSARREADLGIALARADFESACKTALRELEEGLIRLAGAQARLHLHAALAERSAQYAELARKRQATSVADPLDVSLVLTDAAQDQRALIRSRNELRHREAVLMLLLGEKDASASWIIPTLTPGETVETPSDLMPLARAHRDPWRRAHLAYLRAEWTAARTARERIPDLTIGPTVERTSDDTSWGVSLGVPLPLFSHGGAAHGQALAQRDAARVALEAEARTAEVEIELLAARTDALAAEFEALSGEAAAAAGQAYELAQVRYEASQIDVLHLLSAHRAYADLKLELLDLQLAHARALLDLEAAVGWPLSVTTRSLGRETQP